MTRLLFLIRKTLGNIVTRPLAALGSFLSLALLFLLFNIFWVGSLTVTEYYRERVSQIQIELFLADEIPDSTIEVLVPKLQTLEGVSGVEYFSREDARARLQSLTGADLLEGFDDNPLPRSFVLSFREDFLDSRRVGILKNNLQNLVGVAEILYPEQWLQRAEAGRGLVSRILFFLGAVVIAATLLSLIHFLRLSIRTRSYEWVQLSLMGAGQFFLSFPYILEGIIYSLAALAAAWIMLFYALPRFDFGNLVIILPGSAAIVYQFAVAAVSGLIGGWIGARRPV